MGWRNNLSLIAEDLGQRKLIDVLKNETLWDTNTQTVIVAEGLVMYLRHEAVKDLFRQCSDTSGEGSRVAFSYIPMGTDGRPDVGKWTGLMLWLQKSIGEPWLWSNRPEELGIFLEGLGWLDASESAGECEKRGVEYFVVAMKS